MSARFSNVLQKFRNNKFKASAYFLLRSCLWGLIFVKCVNFLLNMLNTTTELWPAQAYTNTNICNISQS